MYVKQPENIICRHIGQHLNKVKKLIVKRKSQDDEHRNGNGNDTNDDDDDDGDDLVRFISKSIGQIK